MNLKRFVAYGTCFFLCMVPVAACTAATPADIPIPPTPTIVPPKPTSILPTAPSAQAKPSPRGVFAMAYDSKSNHVILYGGETGDYKLQASYNGETWAFDVATNSWTNMKPASSPNPRGLAELAYDAESDRIILFEGGSLPTHWKSDDIAWAYDFNTNTWKKMNAKGPTGYLGCQMAYDSESDRIILFGGYNISEDQALQATWAYDYDTDTWTEMKPAVNPPGRNL